MPSFPHLPTSSSLPIPVPSGLSPGTVLPCSQLSSNHLRAHKSISIASQVRTSDEGCEQNAAQDFLRPTHLEMRRDGVSYKTTPHLEHSHRPSCITLQQMVLVPDSSARILSLEFDEVVEP